MQQESSQPDCTIRVLVADNSPFHTQLLAETLRRDPSFHVVSSTLNASNLVAAASEHTIDVFVLSALADGDGECGLRILQELREGNPQARAVVLLNSCKPDCIVEAFRAGAKGVFNIQENTEVLCRGIRRVHEGEAWVSREQMTLLLEAIASTPKLRTASYKGMNLLSKREAEVVRCLAEGLTNREIAQRIGLSQHTIKNYLFHIFDKLGVSNRTELLFMTLSQGANDPLLLESLLDPAESYDDETFALCQRAAENGVAPAQLALARMFWRGRTQDRDVVKAYVWFSIAIDKITRILDFVKKTMSPEQIAKAEAAVRERSHLSKRMGPASTPPTTRSATRMPFTDKRAQGISDSAL